MSHPQDTTIQVTISEDSLNFTLTEETINAQVVEEVYSVNDVTEVFNISVVEEVFVPPALAESFQVEVVEETFDFRPDEVILYRQEDFMVYDELQDQVGDLTLYRGEAAPGTLTSEAKWRIRRVQGTVGGDGKIDYATRFADGSRDFIKVWDDRAGYTY